MKQPFDPQTERVVTAWAEHVSGPGWRNWLIWILIQKQGTNNYRTIALQPDEQTEVMRALHGPAAAMHLEMTALATRLLQDLHAEAQGFGPKGKKGEPISRNSRIEGKE